MTNTLLILDGHPDPNPGRLCHALCQAYADGAREAGHDVVRIDLARLQIPFLCSETDFEDAPPPEIAAVQEAMRRCQHWLIVYPLWLGSMPAKLKGLFEQALRPGFAFAGDDALHLKGCLQGHSARIVVTMGMPALIYRWYFGAHSLKSLERNILKFVGVGPVRETLFGMVDAASDTKRQGWLDTMRDLGRKAS